MKKFNRVVDEYIKLRRHCGYKLKDTEVLLKKFAVFLESKQALYITTELASCFVNQNKQISVSVKSSKMNKIRQFALYMKGIEPKTEIPSSKVFPFSYRRNNPYIYNQTEIQNLLLCCNKLWKDKSKKILRNTYFYLFGLLAITGMRINEALSLTKNSIDLFNGFITITKSKFSKSRIIPIHASTKDTLNKYTDTKIQLSLMSKSDFFFVSSTGHQLKYWNVRKAFNRLLIHTRLKKQSANYRLRIHDLRHSFAVNNLIKWYFNNLNVERNLPILSTYLGHINPANTYWYLSAHPELLRLASKRLQKRKRNLQ